MFKAHRKLEYALMALKFIAEKNRNVSAREIAEKCNIPFDPISKALQIMCHHKILTSIQGIKGGYKLTKNLNEVFYGELDRIINKKDQTSFCRTAQKKCANSGNCIIEHPMEKLNQKINHYLNNLNLEELLLNGNKNTQI